MQRHLQVFDWNFDRFDLITSICMNWRENAKINMKMCTGKHCILRPHGEITVLFVRTHSLRATHEVNFSVSEIAKICEVLELELLVLRPINDE